VAVKQIQNSAAQRSATRADKSVRGCVAFQSRVNGIATAWLFVATGVGGVSR
jgi:hypothetical protein